MQCCGCVCAEDQGRAERWPTLPLALIEIEAVQMKYIQLGLIVSFLHTHSYRPMVTGHSSSRLMMNDEKQNREEKMERKERQGEAVFQSHLANGCHWWIQTPHHSLSHRLLCCFSTTANEINTGLQHARASVCVRVCFVSTCTCWVVVLKGPCIKQGCHFRAASLGWVNVYISLHGDCTTECWSDKEKWHAHWWAWKKCMQFCNSWPSRVQTSISTQKWSPKNCPHIQCVHWFK